MNALNPDIILAGDRFDLMGSLSRGQATAAQGQQFAQQQRQFENQNALNGFVQQNAPQIMAGNQNALNGLASMGPEGLAMAQGTVDTNLSRDATRQGMQATAQRMRILDEQQAAAIRQEAANMSAQQRAQEAAAAERAATMVLSAQSPEQFDALAQQHAPEYVGQFANRDAIAAQFLDLKDVLEMSEADDVGPQSTLGKFYADQAAGLIPADAQPPQSGTNIVNNIPGQESAPMIGTIPQGYQAIREEGGSYRLEPLRGGPEDTTASDIAKSENQQQQADVVLGAIGNIRESLTKENQGGRGMFDAPETGILGSRLANMGINQEAVDVQQELSVLQSAIAFDTLAKMRAASPTGGALGAVSERELLLLQSAMGALSNNVSPEVLMQTLDTIEGIMKKFEAYPNAAEFGITSQGGGDISDEDLLLKYGNP